MEKIIDKLRNLKNLTKEERREIFYSIETLWGNEDPRVIDLLEKTVTETYVGDCYKSKIVFKFKGVGGICAEREYTTKIINEKYVNKTFYSVAHSANIINLLEKMFPKKKQNLDITA